MPKKSFKSKLSLGTTFSYLEAEKLGLKWPEVLKKILESGLNPIRIGTYWNQIEKNSGKYDFSIQDRIIEQISHSKTDIVLTVGVKAPRWPEFYWPAWLKDKLNLQKGSSVTEEMIGKPLLTFLEKTIIRYRKTKNLHWLNIENEPLTQSGPYAIKISPSLLEKEVTLVRQLSSKPIILNSWTELHPLKRKVRNIMKKERSLAICLKKGDILGLSAYPKFPGQPRIRTQHWYFLGQWLHKAKAIGKDAWVTELQAEPWESNDDLKDFSDPFGNSSCNPENIESYLKICQGLGFGTILLWGSEFWHRCLNENNQSWWKVVEKWAG